MRQRQTNLMTPRGGKTDSRLIDSVNTVEERMCQSGTEGWVLLVMKANKKKKFTD